MRKDFDYCVESHTSEEILSWLNDFKPSSTFGFHIFSGNDFLIPYLQNLPEGFEFPIQIASGPLMRLGLWSSLSPELVDLVKTRRVKLFVHMPFVMTFYRQPSKLMYQVRAVQELANYYKKLGIDSQVSLVLHCGHPQLSSDLDLASQLTTAFSWFQSNVSSILNLCNWVVLIENLADSPKALVPMESLLTLWKYYKTFFESSPRLGLCVDTEHLYASGQTFSDIPEDLWKKVGLVHFNSAPSNAKFGEHVDLHSYTQIESSVNASSGTFSVPGNSALEWKNALISLQIKAVFERKIMSIQVQDLMYMNSL